MIFCDAAEPSHCSSSQVALKLGVCGLIASISPLNTLQVPSGPAGSGMTPILNFVPTSAAVPVVSQSPPICMAILPAANRALFWLDGSVALEPSSEPGTRTWYLYISSRMNWKTWLALGVLNDTEDEKALGMVKTPSSARKLP